MKSRKEVVEHFNQIPCVKKRNKSDAWHFGLQEIRSLMDFIYEGEPVCDEEKIESFNISDW